MRQPFYIGPGAAAPLRAGNADGSAGSSLRRVYR